MQFLLCFRLSSLHLCQSILAVLQRHCQFLHELARLWRQDRPLPLEIGAIRILGAIIHRYFISDVFKRPPQNLRARRANIERIIPFQQAKMWHIPQQSGVFQRREDTQGLCRGLDHQQAWLIGRQIAATKHRRRRHRGYRFLSQNLQSREQVFQSLGRGGQAAQVGKVAAIEHRCLRARRNRSIDHPNRRVLLRQLV